MSELLKDLNTEQQAAVTHEDGPLLIVAGAGTGKTTVITRRIAWLIDQKKIKPDEVLALTFTEKAAAEMEERLDRILPYGYVDLWISTFHAFGERVLRAHGLEIGLPDDFRVLDSTGQWLLMRQNVERFELDHYRPLGNPTRFLHALIQHFSRAKDEEIYPEQYLEFVENLCLDADSPEFLEFGEVLRALGTSGIQEGKSKDELKEICTQEVYRIKEVANAYHVYQQLLHENGALDFGDLINYTLKLFRQRPALLEQYRKQFKYLLVDEFQDTNWSQYALVKVLAAPKNNITVVGDDDQSIYKFRGASVSNILEFNKDFPGTTQVVLTKNYRSTQNILDAAYEFIQLNNPHRLEYQLNQAEDVKASAAAKGVDLKSFAKIEKRLTAADDTQGTVEHLHFPSLHDEVRAVLKKIVQIKKDDPSVFWSDFAVLVRANSQAEPFLQAFTAAGLPVEFLASQGLYSKPIVLDVMSYLRMLENPYDGVSLYRLLIMPMYALSWEDLMTLTQATRKKGWSLRQACQQGAALGISAESQTKIDSLLSLMSTHAQLARHERVTKIVYAFLHDSGYLEHLNGIEESAQQKSYSYLNQFWKVLERFEQGTDIPTVKQFLEFFAFVEQAGDSGSLAQDLETSGPETVKILTVHGAKGLEFPYVFIVNLVDRRFPTIERKEPIPLPDSLVKEILVEGEVHLEEERRLFYVAMTRAKRGLFFTSGEDYGGVRKKKISRFLKELGYEDPAARDAKPVTSFEKDGRVAPAFLPGKEGFDIKSLLPKQFSFTQLKAFETCPLQYKYMFLLRVPVQGRHTFSFGKTMHSALQKFFEEMNRGKSQGSLFGTTDEGEQGAPSLERLLELYEESWIDDWYESAEHQEEYKERGRRILKDFYAKHSGKWPNAEFLEKGFNLKVGQYTIRGAIDRVDRLPSGAVEILDYKTGNVPKDESRVDKGQLLIYQLAAEEVLCEQVEQLTYYYLQENKPISFLGDEKQKDKVKEGIQKTIAAMQESDFAATPSKEICRNCDFKSICEFRIL